MKRSPESSLSIPALEKTRLACGRSHTQVGIEINVDGYDAEPWNGITDYCLYLPNERSDRRSRSKETDS